MPVGSGISQNACSDRCKKKQSGFGWSTLEWF